MSLLACAFSAAALASGDDFEMIVGINVNITIVVTILIILIINMIISG